MAGRPSASGLACGGTAFLGVALGFLSGWALLGPFFFPQFTASLGDTLSGSFLENIAQEGL